MIILRRFEFGKNSIIIKIESVFTKNLIIPSLKNGIDKQKVSLADFGKPTFSILLPHKILCKNDYNLVSTLIEKPFETITHMYNHLKITTPCRFKKLSSSTIIR